LRLVRGAAVPTAGAVRVLGVDDWSRRKGRDFGTIPVDLERQRVVDLLPDRTAETLATWLRGHPEVEVVSRDRAGAYAEGIRQGAPQAQQIADRFHLRKNASDALERYLIRQHAAYLQARWAEGCHNATRLHQELQARGFRGGYVSVAVFVAPWRDRGRGRPRRQPYPTADGLATPRRVCWLLLRPAGDPPLRSRPSDPTCARSARRSPLPKRWSGRRVGEQAQAHQTRDVRSREV
jgi:hypothetical protein